MIKVIIKQKQMKKEKRKQINEMMFSQHKYLDIFTLQRGKHWCNSENKQANMKQITIIE